MTVSNLLFPFSSRPSYASCLGAQNSRGSRKPPDSCSAQRQLPWGFTTHQGFSTRGNLTQSTFQAGPLSSHLTYSTASILA